LRRAIITERNGLNSRFRQDRAPTRSFGHLSLFRRWPARIYFSTAGSLKTLRRWRFAAHGWAGVSFYSLDLALAFFRGFIAISPSLNSRELYRWTQCSIRLARADPKTAVEFFKSSPTFILNIGPQSRTQLFTLIQSLTRTRGHESLQKPFRAALNIALAVDDDDELVAKCLELATLIDRQSYFGVEILESLEIACRTVNRLGQRHRQMFSYALEIGRRFSGRFAIDFINLVVEWLAGPKCVGIDANYMTPFELLLQHTNRFAVESGDAALDFFLSGVELLRLGDKAIVEKWSDLCYRIKDLKGRVSSNFVRTAVQPTKDLVKLANEDRDRANALVSTVLETVMRVGEHSNVAAANAYAVSASLLRRTSLTAYLEWAERGLKSITEKNKLSVYFAGQSRTSQHIMADSDDVLLLENILAVLTNYVEMLTGKAIEIKSRLQEYDVIEPETDRWINLPPKIAGPLTNVDRFRLYKILAAQGAGQIEFATHETGTERLIGAGKLLVKKYPRSPAVELNGDTDWYRLVNLFPLTTLSRRLFTILENARIEYLLVQQYRGLRRDIELARRLRSRFRPPDQYLIKYEHLLEILFVEVLGSVTPDSERDRSLSADETKWLEKIREVLTKNIHLGESSVVDTINGVSTLYEYLAPEAPENSVPWEDENKRSKRTDSRSDKEPRSNKKISKYREGKSPQDENVSDGRTESSIAGTIEGTGIIAADSGTSGQAEPLEGSKEPNVFFYDEWDSLIEDYRPRWCRVNEKTWKEGDRIFAISTRTKYDGVLSQIRSQFQMLRPTRFKLTHMQPDGEELDLDALTHFVADKRAHTTPSDLIYTQRQRRERDVSVCFLLDMSASTNKRVARGARVIDIEKEALLLMSEALEAIGDTYAIFGFSGQGRKSVTFYRFKDFGEHYGEIVERRVGAAHPLVNTRLGAAIRHATFRLNEQSAETRLLIVLTDAQPSDDEYSWQSAPVDARASFQEARDSGVTPFCITFNQEDHRDKTEAMFEGFGYAVIDDVTTLPEKLPRLYRRLTT
jgi:nitric oxide reductase NorD protein